jgi:putative ABC transport system permease protein
VGAGPRTILGLLTAEATVLILAGVALGLAMLYAGLLLFRPWIDRAYGIHLNIDAPSAYEWQLLGAIVLAGIVAGLLPALRAYRLSLADGMTVRN